MVVPAVEAGAEISTGVAVGVPVAAAATGVALGAAVLTEVVVHEQIIEKGGYQPASPGPAAIPNGNPEKWDAPAPGSQSQHDAKDQAQAQTATSSDSASGGNKPPTKVAAAAPEEPDKNQVKNARQKGVADMWKQEAEKIKEGKPTRNWSAQQEQDILAGRVPKSEVDGKPIEGAHIESVKDAPEKAGDPNNIKPKSFTEHRAANGGEHSANPKPYDTGPTTTP